MQESLVAHLVGWQFYAVLFFQYVFWLSSSSYNQHHMYKRVSSWSRDMLCCWMSYYQVSPKMSLSSWFETHSNSWQCMMAPHMLEERQWMIMIYGNGINDKDEKSWYFVLHGQRLLRWASCRWQECLSRFIYVQQKPHHISERPEIKKRKFALSQYQKMMMATRKIMTRMKIVLSTKCLVKAVSFHTSSLRFWWGEA